MTVGRAGGKVILVGEHAVVYGHPALALGLDLGTTVRLTPKSGPTTVRTQPCDDRLLAAVRAALPDSGYDVHVQSDLPIGCGMGSSAALSVALVRARARLDGQELTSNDEFARSLELEAVFHGTPSGLDNTVSAHGGLIRFFKGPPATFEHLPPPQWQGVILESGQAGNTAQLVAGVRARHPGNTPTLDAIGNLVERAQACVYDIYALGPLLTENHRLLQKLGVSTPELDDLVSLALRTGATGAKLSGAGGGGVVFALVDNPGPLLETARSRGIVAHLVRPGDSS